MQDSFFRCPICRKVVEGAAPEFPFCSERCRLIDLGNWASGTYAIPEREPDAVPQDGEDQVDLDDDRGEEGH